MTKQKQFEKQMQYIKRQRTEKTVSELLDEYLETYCKQYNKHSTYISYVRRANTSIKPYLGKYRIAELSLNKITNFYNDSTKRVSVASANHRLALIINPVIVSLHFVQYVFWP